MTTYIVRILQWTRQRLSAIGAGFAGALREFIDRVAGPQQVTVAAAPATQPAPPRRKSTPPRPRGARSKSTPPRSTRAKPKATVERRKAVRPAPGAAAADPNPITPGCDLDMQPNLPIDIAAEIRPGEHGKEYAPPQVPRMPPAVPLPPEWYDDRSFQLIPFATAGTSSPGRCIGVLGRMTRGNEKLAVCYDKPFAHAYFGPPGYGKTYGDACHIENVLFRTPYLNVLDKPYCVISESYEYGDSHPPELLKSRFTCA